MERTLEQAEPMITKWDLEATSLSRAPSLFYENRSEAIEFIKTVHNLQRAMHFYATENPSSEKLIQAQNLMQISMKRLQKEFYHILSTERAHLDPESVSAHSSRSSNGSSTSSYNDDDISGDEILRSDNVSRDAMADLKLIAECMISSGYGRECVKIYKIIRKSIVDEGVYRLGVERYGSSQVRKMDWEAVEVRVRKWLGALGTAVRTLLYGERILCDHVFARSDAIRESCFAEITRDGAITIFGFPEDVVIKNKKKSPEKIFRVLDMYSAIADHWSEIESIFSFESTVALKHQVATSLVRLGEYVHSALKEFELEILRDSSRTPFPGAGIHYLTIDAMRYLCNLGDYGTILSDILADSPVQANNLLPESYFGFSDSGECQAPAISVRLAWLIVVLLCKLDSKAKNYKDVALSYLFLANNLQYVVVSVRASNLSHLLGKEWLKRHESKVKQFASKYEQIGWCHVINALPSDPNTIRNPREVKGVFERFNSAFDRALEKNTVSVVPDIDLREEIKASLARKVLTLYGGFYEMHRVAVEKERDFACVVKYTPDDVARRLSGLHEGQR